MNVGKVIRDIRSKDTRRIREAGAEIIRSSQDEDAIRLLIPHINQIKYSTKGLELGGAFASNNRFYKFPIEIIEFHKQLRSIWNRSKKCTCELYLSKTYECFNPDKESENISINQNIKIKGNWTHDSEIECLKCHNKFYVSERHYHYMWWKWTRITEELEFNLSSNSDIDKELKFIMTSIKTMIRNEPKNNTELKFHLQRIKDFRLKLAYSKRTEKFESKFGWTLEFENLINEIELNISNEE